VAGRRPLSKVRGAGAGATGRKRRRRWSIARDEIVGQQEDGVRDASEHLAIAVGIEGYKRIAHPPEIRSGLMLGTGVRTVATQKQHSQGNIIQTNLMPEGDGLRAISTVASKRRTGRPWRSASPRASLMRRGTLGRRRVCIPQEQHATAGLGVQEALGPLAEDAGRLDGDLHADRPGCAVDRGGDEHDLPVVL